MRLAPIERPRSQLARHCDEREIVEITWPNAVSNYFNLLSVPLGIESDGLLELTLRRADRA